MNQSRKGNRPFFAEWALGAYLLPYHHFSLSYSDWNETPAGPSIVNTTEDRLSQWSIEVSCPRHRVSLPITLGSTFRFIAETITKQPRIENIGRFQGNECQVRSWIWRRISHWEPCSPVSTAPVPDSTIEVSGIPLPFPTHVLVQWPWFTCHW